MAERVPLTDQQLAKLADDAAYWGPQVYEQPGLAARLAAELRASRAELSVLRPALRAAKRRIDKALARIDKAEPRQWRRVAVMRDIRAALTGTETTTDGK